MRYLLIAIFLLALADTSRADEWTDGDTSRQLAFSGLTVIDCIQSRDIVKHPDKYYEAWNPVLPRHPTMGQLNTVCAISLVFNPIVAYLLPTDLRHIWQYAWIVGETGAVYHNAVIVGMKVPL